MKINYLKFLPHISAVFIFLIFSCVFYSPLFKGYNIEQGDVKQHIGMSKEIVDYRVMHDDEEPLWTNSMFGGMPAYQISVIHKNNWIYYLDQGMKLGLPRPIAILFWSMLGFYILTLCLRINPWLGIVGAIAFGFSTINILYLGAGHMSKVNAISYMAPAVGGFILAFRGRAWLGCAIFALFFSLQVTANHLQMTYYLVFLLVAIAIAESIRIAVKKEWKSLFISYGVLVLAGFVAILPSASNLTTTQEYGKYTTRGSSELTISPPGGDSKSIDEKGLNKDYILEYNFGHREFLSLAFPYVKGGAQQLLPQNKDVKSIIEGNPKYGDYSDYLLNTDPNRSQFVTYFGGQKMSGGAFYFGIIMIVFALMGFIFLKDWIKWPLLFVSILCVLLASNDPDGINAFFIDHFPMYNKFRDSKMILVLVQINIPLTSLLFLNSLFKSNQDFESSSSQKLMVNQQGKMIFGICSSLAIFYNKPVNWFRAIFVLCTLLLGLGIVIYLCFWFLLPKESDRAQVEKSNLIGNTIWWNVGLISIIYGIIVLYIFPSFAGEFLSEMEMQSFKTNSSMKSEQIDLINGLKKSLIDVRIELFRSDILRGLFLVVISGVLFILSIKNILNKWMFVGFIFVLVAYDNISISKRYFNNEEIDPMVNIDRESKQIDNFIKLGYLDKLEASKFLSKYEFKELSTIPKAIPSRSDSSILIREKARINDFDEQRSSFISKMEKNSFYNNNSTIKTKEMIANFAILNKNTNYRVFTFGNPFNETNTSYFHKSVGGYHGAKLKRYQELIDFYILPESEKLKNEIGNYFNSEASFDLPPTFPVLNMLNTKYFIFNPGKEALKNDNINGSSWFVSEILPVKSANEEMLSIGSINTKTTAVVNVNEFNKSMFNQNQYENDSTDYVELIDYDINKITYESNSTVDRPAIFSEIWYPDGWNCYIDGEKTENIFRANYILRGAIIPSGKHKIEWKFEPKTFNQGSTYSFIGSILMILLLIGISLKEFNVFKRNA